MKLFKITEHGIQSVLNLLSEFPIKHQNLIQAIVEVIKGLEEIVEHKDEQIKD